jgi:hypothetical protein
MFRDTEEHAQRQHAQLLRGRQSETCAPRYVKTSEQRDDFSLLAGTPHCASMLASDTSCFSGLGARPEIDAAKCSLFTFPLHAAVAQVLSPLNVTLLAQCTDHHAMAA